MQRLTLVLSLFCILNIKAQSATRTCDTCINRSANHFSDSLKKTLSNKRNYLHDSGLIQSQKDIINDKTNQAMSSGQSTFDSSARADYSEKAKNTILQPLNRAKALPKPKWELIKTKIPKGKQLFSFSGQLRSESYATTAQNPMVRSEPAYSRLYVSPTITLLGLPFTSNFFFTTEANNTYKNNFFSIRFDANAMRQNALNQIQKELDEAKKLDRLRQVDIQKYKLETDRYRQELDRLEKQVPDLKSWQDELKTEAELQTKKRLEKEKQALEERIKNLPEDEKKRLEEEFKQKQDSIIGEYKKGAEDSFMRAKSAGKSNIDTSKVNRYLRLKSKLSELQSKKEALQDLRQQDSAKLLEKTRGIRDPDELKTLAGRQMPGKKLLQSVLSVDRFGIGLVNPVYSDFTLSNTSVKGIDIGINKRNYFYDITIGKTTRQFFSPFSNLVPEYNRFLGIARLGLGELKGDYMSMEYLYAFDKDIVEPVQPLVRNGVWNLSARYLAFKTLQIEGNIAQSTYKETYRSLERAVINTPNTALKPEHFRAYQLKVVQAMGKHAKLEAQIKQTGAGFRTVGNPFLRRNFRELELKYEQTFFKQKLRFSSFYKEMRDNLLELNSATNRLRGYGVKASTAFDKLPNLTLSYSPYQQGNNHPDSLYRTNNQFSITTAMISYKLRRKQMQWHALLNYTRSAMELGERGHVAYRLISTVHSFQFSQRHSVILSYMNNSTGPSVDSLNSNSVQCNYNYLYTKKMSFGIVSEYTQYKNEAFKAGGGLQMNASVFRNFSLSLLGRYDKLDRLWNLDNADVFSGRLIMVWQW